MKQILDTFMIFMTTLGNTGMIWIALIILLLIRKQTRFFGYLCLIALLSEYFINDMIIKDVVARDRPFIAHNLDILIKPPSGYSFPSGHSASSFAFAGMFLLFKQKGRFLVLVIATFIAFSRVYLDVHYLSDVLVGITLGLAVAAIIYYKYYRSTISNT